MEPLEQAKRPITIVAGLYGHPLHPAMVAVPIGAWVASLVFDVGSHLAPDPGFLTPGSRWLIAIGILGALAAAVPGFLDLFGIPTGTLAFRTGLIHMSLNLAVTAVYAVGFLWRAGDTGPVSAGQIALSAVSLAALGVSGYLGGMLAFRYGVRVANESTQLEGFRSTTSDKET